MVHIEGIDKVLRNKALFESGKVGTGGYSLTFNDSIDIPSYVLYEAKENLPIRKSDFDLFVQKNVFDTTDICDILECTRQNVAYMIKRQMILPIKEEVKGNLYLKGDVLRNRW